MMRGTYFRAWDIYNQAWADEYLAITEDGYVVEIKNDGTTEYWKDRFIIEFDTGLKDKNGKEVYEGDILKFEDSIFEIGWLNKGARFGFCPVKNCNFGMGFSLSRSEVIGNIHENGELIEKEQ